jgi:hypothetical protein
MTEFWKSVFVVFMLSNACLLHGQDTLFLNLSADTILYNVLNTNNFDKQTEIEEIQNLYKLSLWHFAPGISYDFIRNRTYLTISTSGLVSHFVNKKQEKRRIGAIERKYKAKELSDEIKVTNSLLSIQADYRDLVLSKKSVQIEVDIFLIYKEQHSKNEIDTEKFLNSKKNIINAVKSHNSAVTELYRDILTLSNICNIPISADLSHLYFTLDFLE